MGGQLKTIVYGRVVAVHVDPIEKKPLFHFHPQSRSFSIATAGCNMNCLFCQNWQISQALPEDTRFMKLNPKEVVNLALQNKCDSIAYTYTEPTIFFEFMRDTAKLAKENKVKNVWITCGYIEEKPLRELCKYIDAANVDLKGFSEKFYLDYTNGKLKPVLDTFKILKEEGVWIELTNLVIPGANDSPQMISNLCAWVVKELGTGVPVHFSRFHPDYKLQDRPPTPVATINRAVDIARGFGIKYVYSGNVAGDKNESTYCPKCGKKIITRRGYQISDIKIKKGKCAFCGTKIDGRW
jgi:pyruvate formate lyase activating enzyme